MFVVGGVVCDGELVYYGVGFFEFVCYLLGVGG